MTKPRKPAPFVVDGWKFAECEVMKDECDGSRLRIVRVEGFITRSEIPTFRRWLSRAEAWVDQEEAK